MLHLVTAGGVQHRGLDQEPHAGEEAGAAVFTGTQHLLLTVTNTLLHLTT
jgi:hypothetical protein